MLVRSITVVSVVFILAISTPARAATLKCPADSAKVGDTCVDKYEASIWAVSTTNGGLIKKIAKGKATLADLTAAGATQVGCTSAPYNHSPYPANFPITGDWTPNLGSDPPSPGVYAVAIPGVMPSSCMTWFQAEQACALSGKHLIRNEEWSRAAAGTPDPGSADDGTTTCATNSANPVVTGSRSACKSNWGVFDMIGNVAEVTSDWSEIAESCVNWSIVGFADNDYSCIGGPGTGDGTDQALPRAIIRGGFWDSRTEAGVRYMDTVQTWPTLGGYGFRCAR